MNMKHILLAGVLALGVAAGAAHAQDITTGPVVANGENSGDLILGFYSSSAGSDVTFDLGQASQFSTATDNANNPGTLVAGTQYKVDAFTLADVNSVTGLGFNASTSWGVLGGTVQATYGNDPIWTTALPGQAVFSTNGQSTAASSLDGVATETGNSFGTTGTGNPVAAQLGDKAFFTQSSSSYGGQYNFAVSTAAPTGTGSTSLDLWELDGTTTGTKKGIDLGTFMLDAANNTLYFTPAGAAIPEPSTYAMILGAITIGFVALRRRTAAGLGAIAA